MPMGRGSKAAYSAARATAEASDSRHSSRRAIVGAIVVAAIVSVPIWSSSGTVPTRPSSREQALHAAAATGDTARVRTLLEAGTDPNVFIDGASPLHVASSNGHSGVIEALFSAGADVNARQASHRYTPLILAAQHARAGAIATLIRTCGAPLEASGDNGYTALHAATFEGDENALNALLDAGADVSAQGREGFRPLHIATFFGRVGAVRTLLQRGAPLDASKEGHTALHVAASNRRDGVAALLLWHGASPHARTVFGETALHKACLKGDDASAQILLKHGARLDALDLHGDSPLHVAAHTSEEVLRTLLMHELESPQLGGQGADFWRGVRHAAAWAGAVDALRMMLPPQLTGDDDDTLSAALVVAAARGRADAVNAVLEHGTSTLGIASAAAVAHAADAAGRTPLEAATANGRCDTVRLLLKRGAWQRGGGAKASSGSKKAGEALLRRCVAVAASAAAGPRAAGSKERASSSLPTDAAWRAHARAMPPLSRRLLVLGEDPSSVDAASLVREATEDAPLSKHMQAVAALEAQSSGAVLHVPAALGADACAVLRAAVDANGTRSIDSVDRLQEHVLYLSEADLEGLLDRATLDKLLALPAEFQPQQSPPARLFDCFVRRYSADASAGDQLLTSFHMDTAHTTVNVALTADAHIDGGRLLGVYDGGVHVVPRAEGDATVHSSSLLHGVTRMHSGVRYSMIMFYSPLVAGA